MGTSERPERETGAESEGGAERRHTGNLADDKQPVPLFLRDRSDGRQGNAQDEKDEAGE